MMPNQVNTLAASLAGWSLLVLFSACDRLAEHRTELVTGGDYGPVTHDMVAGASLRFRTGRDETYDDLTWRFAENTFQIRAGANGLPRVLAARLLPEGLEAREITGSWSVESDIITFTNITADGVPTNQEPRRLKTMFTGVLRVEAGPHYVFSRGLP